MSAKNMNANLQNEQHHLSTPEYGFVKNVDVKYIENILLLKPYQKSLGFKFNNAIWYKGKNF